MRFEDSPSRANALIGAIYRAALDPTSSLALRDHLFPAIRESPSRTAQEQHFLDHVLGHVQRALQLAETQEQMAQERRQLERLVDALAPAICIVRSDATLVVANRTAMETFCPLADSTPLTAHLDLESGTALKQALLNAEQVGYSAVRLRLEHADDSLWVHVGRLSSAPETLLALIVFPEDEPLRTALHEFVHQHGLTLKERSVMEQALHHPRLADAAQAEAIGYHTARQHLRSIYDKTGARSQTEVLGSLMRHVIVREAIRTEDAGLLPQARPVRSHSLEVGSRERPRSLCYAIYGDPNGLPVLYYHTVSGSHLELALHQDRLVCHGIRLIAVDRPGYGGSDYVEYENYEAFSRDARLLLDHLKLSRVGLLACSAGVPHALSCAARYPERVSLVQCAGGIPPREHVFAAVAPARRQRLQAHLFRVAPGLMRPALELLLRRQTVESVVRLMRGDASKLYRFADKDVEFISQPANFDHFVATTITALQQGTRAWAKEGAMASMAWGIPFDRTQCPVRFWHGSADEVFPVEMIESFVSEFRDARVTHIEDETHLLVHRQLDRILPEFHEFA